MKSLNSTGAVSDRSIGQFARDLGVGENSISRWVAQHAIDIGEGQAGALTTDQREELRRVRRENKQLLEDRETLKKPTAFFGKERR